MDHLYLQKLSLENYRNFSSFNVEVNTNPVIIIGENGSGKTNILEAISLFSPGRGIRSAKVEDLCKSGEGGFSLKTLMNSKLGIADLQSHVHFSQSSKRAIEFNGAKIPNSDLSKFSNMLWLTPQMDGIFLSSPTDRRRFFDRIVFNFYSNHASLLNKYEHYIRERLHLLKHGNADPLLLNVLEQSAAEIAVIIAKNRESVRGHLQAAIDSIDTEFPKADLYLSGSLAGSLQNSALDPDNINELQSVAAGELEKSRAQDAASGRTNFGVHRTDLVVIHRAKSKLAHLCSTGEQKAMLITIMLGSINSAIKYSNVKPIVLLDEVFVHLDNNRKDYLTSVLLDYKIQAWVTATDLSGIENFAKHAQVIGL